MVGLTSTSAASHVELMTSARKMGERGRLQALDQIGQDEDMIDSEASALHNSILQSMGAPQQPALTSSLNPFLTSSVDGLSNTIAASSPASSTDASQSLRTIFHLPSVGQRMLTDAEQELSTAKRQKMLQDQIDRRNERIASMQRAQERQAALKQKEETLARKVKEERERLQALQVRHCSSRYSLHGSSA